MPILNTLPERAKAWILPRVSLRLPWASYVIHQILDDFFVLIYVTATQHKPEEPTHNSHQTKLSHPK